MEVTCTCGKKFEVSLGATHSVGADTPHTHANCPTCGKGWTVNLDQHAWETPDNDG